MSKLLDACSQALMETAPQIMQAIRVEMRRGRGSDISIPQFRAMRFIQRYPDSSLSSLAEHLGLTPPSVSKLVDGLVNQKLILRGMSPEDRRKITLSVTTIGSAIVNSARTNARSTLAEKMKSLSDSDLQSILQAMQLLHLIFNDQGKQDSQSVVSGG